MASSSLHSYHMCITAITTNSSSNSCSSSSSSRQATCMFSSLVSSNSSGSSSHSFLTTSSRYSSQGYSPAQLQLSSLPSSGSSKSLLCYLQSSRVHLQWCFIGITGHQMS